MSLGNFMHFYNDQISDKTRHNSEPVISDDGQYFTYYHVSSDGTLKSLIPRVPDFRATGEDNTVARVCAGNSVLGCMIAHQRLISDFLNADSDAYKGGWYVYSVKADNVLRPKKKLVYDALRSGERWLVPYDKDHWEYPVVKTAKFFFDYVTIHNSYNQKLTTGKIGCYVEVFDDETEHQGIKWSKAIHLDPGYYYLEFNLPNNRSQWNRHRHDTVKKIDKDEYLESKALNASLLSADVDHTPQVGDYMDVEDDRVIDPAPCSYKVVKREGNRYWTEHNPVGEDPYDVPPQYFTSETISKDGDRVCFATYEEKPAVSTETRLPLSSAW